MNNDLPATKKDVENVVKALEAKMVTKDEAKHFVTKDELKAAVAKLATKEELIDEIKQLESRIIDHLDSFMTEIKSASEEREIVSYRLSDHEDRIATLETKFPVSAPV